MIYVGIDWADDHHDVVITDDLATTLAQFQIAHNIDGFATLHNTIAKHEKQPSSALVAIETNRGILVHELLSSGYVVYAINPKAVNRYKDRHTLSKAKSDPLDAMALAHLLRTDRHRFKPIKPLPDEYRLLERLCNDLRKLVNEKTKIINQITSCLKEFYPKALEFFSSIDSNIAIEFLKAFPDPNTLNSCSKQTFFDFFQEHQYSRPGKVEKLWEIVQTKAPETDKVVAFTSKLRIESLIAQLIILREHVTHYEKEIQAILDKLPETKTIESLPGVGKRIAPELTAILGPNSGDSQNRFQSGEAIAKLAGCVPVTRSSGRWKKVYVRRACVKSYRRTFRDWAFTSLKESVWAKAYYDYYKAHNQSHETILRNLGKKWTKILFALWSQGATYNEALHIVNLKKHNIQWAMAL